MCVVLNPFTLVHLCNTWTLFVCKELTSHGLNLIALFSFYFLCTWKMWSMKMNSMCLAMLKCVFVIQLWKKMNALPMGCWHVSLIGHFLVGTLLTCQHQLGLKKKKILLNEWSRGSNPRINHSSFGNGVHMEWGYYKSKSSLLFCQFPSL